MDLHRFLLLALFLASFLPRSLNAENLPVGADLCIVNSLDYTDCVNCVQLCGDIPTVPPATIAQLVAVLQCRGDIAATCAYKYPGVVNRPEYACATQTNNYNACIDCVKNSCYADYYPNDPNGLGLCIARGKTYCGISFLD